MSDLHERVYSSPGTAEQIAAGLLLVPALLVTVVVALPIAAVALTYRHVPRALRKRGWL